MTTILLSLSVDLTCLGTSCKWNPEVFNFGTGLFHFFLISSRSQNFLSQGLSCIRDGLAFARTAEPALSFQLTPHPVASVLHA